MNRIERLGFAAVLGLCTAWTSATEHEWVTPAGGSFGSVFNWSPIGTPGAGDTGLFSLGDVYTVTFSGSESCDDVSVSNGSVTLDSASIPWDFTIDDLLTVKENGTLSITDMRVINSNLASVGQGGTLFVLDDGLLRFRIMNVGANLVPMGSLNVIGPTARIETAGAGTISLSIASNGGTGFFSVCDGAIADIEGTLRLASSGLDGDAATMFVAAGGMLTTDFAYFAISGAANISADVSVIGPASTLTVDTTLIVGSPATVDLFAGATLDLGFIANRVLGTLTLEASTLIIDNYLEIRGGMFTADAASVIDIDDGVFFSVTQGGTIDWDQDLDVSGVSIFDPITCDVLSGGLFEVALGATIGGPAFSKGIVTVDGGREEGAGPAVFVPSTLRGAGTGAGADLVVGGIGTGELTVSGGGFVQFGNDGVFGASFDGCATVIVTGEDPVSGTPSTIDLTIGGASAELYLGQSGDVDVDILDGGRIIGGGDGFIAANGSSQTDVTMIGGSDNLPSLQVGGNLYIGGDASGAGGSATLCATNGATVACSQMRVYDTAIVTLASNGRLRGSTLENFGVIAGSTSLEFTTVTNHGSIEPGVGGRTPVAGDFDIEGNFVQTAGGTLRLDILDEFGDFDDLNVGGDLDLGGTLVLDTPTGAVIPSGTSYEIIDFFGSAIDTDFDLVVPPPGYTASLSVIPEAIVLTLTVACAADLDGTGDVGFTDLVALLASWGGPDGDVNGDGTTDFTDLVELLATWGACR